MGEVVFVSADRSKEDMESYYKESHGKWLCAEHRSDVSDKLGEHFECPHYPYMVVVKADGTFVTKDGTGDVRSHYTRRGQKLWRNGFKISSSNQQKYDSIIFVHHLR